MDPIKILKFDIHGTDPVNTFKGEKIKIKDKTCPWIIPDGSPYFAEPALVRVYDQRGALLVLGRDYWLEEEFPPFCDLTGRSIRCFIQLSEAVRLANDFVTVDYQSIGAYFVPRTQLDDWLYQMQHGKEPIPWSKVFNVPPTLPPEFHSHSNKTEIGDWYELSFFFKTLAGIYRTRDVTIYPETDRVINDAFAKLKAYKDDYLNRINTHDKRYDAPHQPGKAGVGLGNLANYRTATPAQDLEGLRADLYSTPMGVQQLAKQNRPDTSDLMQTGIAPFSKFSNAGYIPPTITGSFEGLGSVSECMGICVERDGRVALIQNHFDGRTEGLYFSLLSDFKNAYDPKNPYRFDYTAYRYEPPVLTNQGIYPNHIIGGSGNDVIMVGKTNPGSGVANDRWFVALTNESFDPSGHRYIEVNMAPIFTQCGNPDVNGEWANYLYHGRMSIALLDQYVYLVVDSPMWEKANQAGRMSYWRIPRQALIDGTPATWQLVKITYQDWDGVQYTNANYWEYAQKQISNGTVTRWGRYNFSPEAPHQNLGQFSRRILTMFAKKPGTKNIFYLNWVGYTFIDWTPPNRGLIPMAAITNMVYEFNIETGVMTLLYKQPTLKVDYQTPNLDEVLADRNKWIQWYNPTVRYMYCGVVFTPDGERLSSITGSGQEATVLNTVVEYSQFRYASNGQTVTSRADLLKGNVGTDRVQQSRRWERVRSLLTPIPTGIGSRQLAYEKDGENFLTYPTTNANPAGGQTPPVVVCRNISGPFAVRPEVYNRTQSPVYSRPLTNNVYNTNMNAGDGVVSITGTSAELAARGVDAGTMSLSYCGWSSKHDTYGTANEIPTKASKLRASNETGAFISFPKTYKRELNVADQSMIYTPTAFYGLATAVRDKLRTLIPSAKRGAYWCFELVMLNAEQGGMFAGLNTAMVKIKYPSRADAGDGNWDSQMFLVTPVVEAPNANHPGVHLITDVQVVGSSTVWICQRSVRTNNQGAFVYAWNRPLLSLYRSGNTVQGSWVSGFSTLQGSTNHDQAVFTLNLSNGAFSGVGGTYVAWSYAEYVVLIPRVGRSRVTVLNPDTYSAVLTDIAYPAETSDPSGGSSRIFPVIRGDGGTDWYAAITSYPDSGWVIFCLEEVELMINSTMHRMPTGNIDLRDIDPDPRNKTFYLYATVEDSKPKYVISVAKLRVRSGFLLAATITTNEKQIITIARHKPFMVGEYTLSFSRDGGIIPISSGFPQDEGNFRFLRNAELLP